MRKMSPVVVTLLIGSLLAVACSGAESDGEYTSQPEEASASAPSEKTDFTLHLFDPAEEDLEGETVSLQADLLKEGKPVVVNFWATWCGPCLVELPHFERLARERPDLVVTTVAVADTTDYFPRFMEGSRLTLPVLLDPNSDVSEALKADALPSTLVFAPDGDLVLRHVGSFYSSEQIAEFVDSALAGRTDLSEP